MSERPAFRDAILNTEDVQRLLKRLTLVERFHAVMVTCEMPRVTNALVEILRTELSERRGTEMRIVRLDPYPFHKDLLAPISEHLLLDEILEKLVFPAPEHQGSSVATIVDASRAMPADDDAWSVLFQRMNERRNAMMLAVPGPLLIVGPRRYAALVGRAAPDLWSIVGALVDVPTPAMEEEWRAVFGEDEPFGEVDQAPRRLASAFVTKIDAKYVVWAEQLVAEARTHWARHPNHDMVAMNLAAQLVHLGMLRAQQMDASAITLLDEAVQILQTPANRAKRRVDIDLTWEALTYRGIAHLLHQQFDRALDDLVESTRGIRRTLQLEPQSSAAKIGLASNLFALGILHQEMGHVDEAVACYSESIVCYHNLVPPDDGASWVKVRVSQAHNNLGDIARAKRDWDSAWTDYEKSTTLSRKVLQRNPRDEQAPGSFAWTRLNMSKLQWLRGDLVRARAIAQDTLSAIEGFLADAQPAPSLVELATKIRTHLAQLDAGTN